MHAIPICNPCPRFGRRHCCKRRPSHSTYHSDLSWTIPCAPCCSRGPTTCIVNCVHAKHWSLCHGKRWNYFRYSDDFLSSCRRNTFFFPDLLEKAACFWLALMKQLKNDFETHHCRILEEKVLFRFDYDNSSNAYKQYKQWHLSMLDCVLLPNIATAKLLLRWWGYFLFSFFHFFISDCIVVDWFNEAYQFCGLRSYRLSPYTFWQTHANIIWISINFSGFDNTSIIVIIRYSYYSAFLNFTIKLFNIDCLWLVSPIAYWTISDNNNYKHNSFWFSLILDIFLYFDYTKFSK